jgi:uncharacterized membrane protein
MSLALPTSSHPSLGTQLVRLTKSVSLLANCCLIAAAIGGSSMLLLPQKAKAQEAATEKTTEAPQATAEPAPQAATEATDKTADTKPSENNTAEAQPPADKAAVNIEAGDPASDAKTAAANDQPAKEENAKGIVDFQKDIAPLLAAKCLECHGPKKAKNDFRVDDRDAMLGYLEVGDSSSSSLITDYLLTDDPEEMMPPPSHGGPLKAAEIALVKLWIDEGANWPENVTVTASAEGAPSHVAMLDPPHELPKTLAGRLWAFQGFLHPATVHFPIALLILGAFAAIASFLPGWTSAEAVAKTCLFFGAISSVAACMMGWSFAVERGYGDWTNMEGEIFWHRVSGIVLAVFAIGLMFVSWSRKSSTGKTLLWKFGLVVAAGIVGLVGHQGGELTYGKAMFDRAFEHLTGEPLEKPAESPNTTKEESSAQPDGKANQEAQESDPQPADENKA